MFRRFFWTSLFFLFGFLILVISVLRTASLRHSFNFGDYRSANVGYKKSVEEVGYFFVYPGRILPDHPLWFLKVARDRFWFFLTPGFTRKAELNLLFSDKRLMASLDLYQKGKFEKAFDAMIRSDNYFKDAVFLEERARREALNTDDLLALLSKASYARWKIFQDMKELFPPEVSPELDESMKYYLDFYRKALDILVSKNINISSFPKI